MDLAFLSSGDLIADRRASYAQMLADTGDFSAAAELMIQALEVASGWAAGWMLLARFHKKTGDIAAAIGAWERVAVLDPAGRLGAQMELAAQGAGKVSNSQQTNYVAALFDHYASDFEASLVERLDYVVPDRLFALISAVMDDTGIGQFARMVDLGCGTGLMGDRMRGLVSHLAGVDVSVAMIGAVRRKAIYDAAEQGELLGFLQSHLERANLITAADVFMYCGALEPVFAAVYARLAPGGLFAFSVEHHAGPEPRMLQASLRYAHNADAIIAMLGAAGLQCVREERGVIRQDEGEPVQGLLVVARKPEAECVVSADLGEAEALDAPASRLH